MAIQTIRVVIPSLILHCKHELPNLSYAVPEAQTTTANLVTFLFSLRPIPRKPNHEEDIYTHPFVQCI